MDTEQLDRQVEFTAHAEGRKASEGDGRTAADIRQEQAAEAEQED